MIAVINVEITAANPSMPLFPWRAYVNSPSSLRIRNVPRRVGNWNIDKVYVSAAYPDNSIKSAECVLVGGVWVCTIAGSTVSGFSQNGYTIFADGKDENGNEVTGYVLGKGDITILEADGTITPGENTYYVHMLSAEPTTPKDGDLWQLSGTWYIYQDGTSYPIGGDSELIQQLSARVDSVETALSGKADKSQLASYELKADMQNDVSNIVTARTLTDWNFPEKIGSSLYGIDEDWIRQNGDPNETYYLMYVMWNSTGDDRWLVVLDRYSWDGSSDWLMFDKKETPVSAPEDTLTLNFSFYIDTEEVPVVLSRENHNALGLAMMTDVETKQDKLSDPQISAVNSVVDERATVIEFEFAPTRTFNWSGAISRQTMIDAGLYSDEEGVWAERPTAIKVGTAVTGIGDYAFEGCEALTIVEIPDSVTSIGDYAFNGCSGLANVTILDNGLHNLKTIGDSAFQGCSNLISITLPQGIATIGVDAFAETISYFKLYLTEAIPSWVPGSANYPWGVAYTSNIITVRNATKEWVEEQAYGKGFVWRNATVNARLHTCEMLAFNINALTLNSAVASFKVKMNATAYTTARDLYFALTIGNFAQPMTWDTPFDKFEGGSAAAIAPKPNTTNIYHIFEYASGHFMVSKFGSAYDELGNIETLINAI